MRPYRVHFILWNSLVCHYWLRVLFHWQKPVCFCQGNCQIEITAKYETIQNPLCHLTMSTPVMTDCKTVHNMFPWRKLTPKWRVSSSIFNEDLWHTQNQHWKSEGGMFLWRRLSDREPHQNERIIQSTHCSLTCSAPVQKYGQSPHCPLPCSVLTVTVCCCSTELIELTGWRSTAAIRVHDERMGRLIIAGTRWAVLLLILVVGITTKISIKYYDTTRPNGVKTQILNMIITWYCCPYIVPSSWCPVWT